MIAGNHGYGKPLLVIFILLILALVGLYELAQVEAKNAQTLATAL